MLTDSTIETIKTITPVVAPNAETLTRRFYELLFEHNPEVSVYFNQANQATGHQQRALANSICAYFSNIDNLAALGPAVSLIAHKHCSLGIQPEHYPIVGKHLIAAVHDVMGPAATEPIVGAIAEAYGFLAKIMIDAESAIYAGHEQQAGGWIGYRKFIVDRKTAESDIITSFYLKPEDGLPLPTHKPGQYITVRVPDRPHPNVPRNYSLSDAPNGTHFRISVKRESPLGSESPAGTVSNYLHDHVKVGDPIEIGPPCGDFVLDTSSLAQKPVVLLAAGVGITPLLAMAKHLMATDYQGQVKLLHVVRNKAMRPFASELDLLASKPNFESRVVLSEEFVAQNESSRSEQLTQAVRDFLSESTDTAQAQYFVCGPQPFMATTISSLDALQVPREKIAFEFFGPLQGIEKSDSNAKCPFH